MKRNLPLPKYSAALASKKLPSACFLLHAPAAFSFLIDCNCAAQSHFVHLIDYLNTRYDMLAGNESKWPLRCFTCTAVWLLYAIRHPQN